MNRMIAQVRYSRAVLLPASDALKGHQALSEAALWTEHLRTCCSEAGCKPLRYLMLDEPRSVEPDRSRTVVDNDEALLSDVAFEAVDMTR